LPAELPLANICTVFQAAYMFEKFTWRRVFPCGKKYRLRPVVDVSQGTYEMFCNEKREI